MPPFVTSSTERKAWEEKFLREGEKLCKEIVPALNTTLPRDEAFDKPRENTADHIFGPKVRALFSYIIQTRGGTHRLIEIMGLGPSQSHKNTRIKWEIVVLVLLSPNPYQTFSVPITFRDTYTERELQRARDSIIQKLLDLLERIG